MPGETDLDTLLRSLSPQLHPQDYVFCTLAGANYGDLAELTPIASFVEREGLTLVLPRMQADRAGLAYQALFRAITLQVHSSLEAVGLTAAVATALARAGISANVIAAFYHDHVFVPAERADEAINLLQALGQSPGQ